MVQCINVKGAEWQGYDCMKLKLEGVEEFSTYKLMKSAIQFLHAKIDVKPSTSKDLYKKEIEVWKTLKDKRLEELKMTENFELNSDLVCYLVEEDKKEIIDIISFKNESQKQEFELKYQQYNLDLYSVTKTHKIVNFAKIGLEKFIIYDKEADIENSDYTPVEILELSHKRARYFVYTGIIIPIKRETETRTRFLLMPNISATIKEDTFSGFIEAYDMSTVLNYAIEESGRMYNAYTEFKKENYEISVRELIVICKKLDYKLELKDSNTLKDINSIGDKDNNEIIQKFFSSFINATDESAYEILQMGDVKKSFRYNKLTILNVLYMLSIEYVEYANSKVTAEILGDLVYKLFHKQYVDKVQSESVKKEIENKEE